MSVTFIYPGDPRYAAAIALAERDADRARRAVAMAEAVGSPRAPFKAVGDDASFARSAAVSRQNPETLPRRA